MRSNTKEPHSATPRGTAYDGAVRILGMREHSRFELRQKLESRGFEADDIEKALDRLTDQKYLDDTRFAQIVARQYSTLGRRGLTEQMTKRGIAPEIWRTLVEEIGSEQEFERALEAARKKSSPVPEQWDQREKWRRRTSGYLMRRGFAPATVSRVLSVLSDQPATIEELEYGRDYD